VEDRAVMAQNLQVGMVVDEQGNPVQTGLPVGTVVDEAGNVIPAAPQPTGPQRSTGADIAIGAAKGLGRQVTDVARLLFDTKTNPAAVLNPITGPAALATGALGVPFDRLSAAMTPENETQQYSGLAAEIATAAIPGGLAAKGARVLRPVAAAIERRAVPGLTARGAEQVLERGLGRITEKNAAALAKEARATPAVSAQVVMRGGKWVPKSKGPSKLQPSADAMRAAVDKPSRSMTWPEVAALMGGGAATTGYLFGSPAVGAALGATRLLARPRVASTVAQGLHRAAPAVQATAGGGAGILADLIIQAIMGGGER
jgi:hypothetical protein